jgi:hypothetical protein
MMVAREYRVPEMTEIDRLLNKAGLTLGDLRERQSPHGAPHIRAARHRVIRICSDQGLRPMEIADWLFRDPKTILHSLRKTAHREEA